MKIKLVAQPSVEEASDTAFLFDVSAEGSDAEGNQAKATAIPTVELKITGSADITVSNSNASSTVEKR